MIAFFIFLHIMAIRLPSIRWPDGSFVVAYDTDKISNSTKIESILFISSRKAAAIFEF